MRLPVLSYAAVVLGGMAAAACGQTGYGDHIRESVKQRGATAADEALRNLEWGLCSASTVGAIKRRYVNTVKWRAYAIICEWPESYSDTAMHGLGEK